MYRDRIATLQPSYAALGPLFAAAPDLLAALREVNIFMRIARQHFPKSIHDADRFALEQTCAAVGTAIAKAEGKS
jgi:hypothetical protein